MTDDRFRELRERPAPDLWSEIDRRLDAEARTTRPSRGPQRQRWVAAAVAVVFTAVLALSLIALSGVLRRGDSPLLSPSQGSSAQPSTTPTSNPSPTTPSVPDVALIVCDGTGTEVLTPTVRAQSDGVHFLVRNTTAERLSVSAWAGGSGADPGDTEFVSRFDPGRASVKCVTPAQNIGDDRYADHFEVIDPDGFFGEQTASACPNEGGGVSGEYPFAVGEDPIEVTRQALALPPHDELLLLGYPDVPAGAVEVIGPIGRSVVVLRDGKSIAGVGFMYEGDGRWGAYGFGSCPGVELDYRK